jgi:uncharacterized protein YjiS (DUF1127 family)
MSTLLQERQQSITAPRLRDRVAVQRASRARWRVILGSIVATLREWRRRSVARRELASFDERMLRDIGIDPSIVDYEMRQSFWRPVRDWRQ